MHLKSGITIASRLLAALFCVFSLEVIASEAPALPGPLVSAEWLQNNSDHLVVLDVRKDIDSFLTDGHIEGAVLVNGRKARVSRKQGGHKLIGMLPNRTEYEQFMSNHGVGTNSTVVITNRGETPSNVAGAARFYWQMKYYGFKRVALLDGGNRGWVDALGDLTNNNTIVEPAPFTAGEIHNEILATIQDVEQALTDNNILLVDTRDLQFHIGLKKRDYVASPGHIPGSRLLPYKFLHPEKGAPVYSPVDVMEQTLTALRIDTNKELILYCNSAWDCSDVWFAVHELLGKRNVRIYDGALNEWTLDGSHPMTRAITR